MVYTLRFFFSLKCSLFHNSNLFGSCIIHILYSVCAKIKKNNSGAKRLTVTLRETVCYRGLQPSGWRQVTIQFNSIIREFRDQQSTTN